MKKNKNRKHMNRDKHILIVWLCLGVTMFQSLVSSAAEHIVLQNNRVSLKFSAENGAFISMEDMSNKKNISSAEKSEDASPWELSFDEGPRNFSVKNLKEFSYLQPDESTLVLTWKGVDDPEYEEMCVRATVKIKENSALTYWTIELDGIADKKLLKVTYPKISGIETGEKDYLAVPQWMGELLQNPMAQLTAMKKGSQRFTWSYPGLLSMQFLALYNNERGLYAACDDSEIYGKDFLLSLDSKNTMVYQMDSYPEQDMSKDRYVLGYNAIVGPFVGDWLSAAELYRDWGEKQQWASDSRFKKGLTPEWLTNTALWVWNRGRSEEVLLPAIDIKERLDLPVNVLWHWWHGGSYDDSFPDYLPPRDGRREFLKKVEQSQDKGIHSLVYMNQLQWGPTTQSWNRENASSFAIKDPNGEMRTHVYNIFTKKGLTEMCIASAGWRDKYAGLADSVINNYGLDGIYMDQACISRRCYDPSHGHPLGGGNYWVENSGKLTDQIRKDVKNNKRIALSGEGSGEAWMPHLDVFLALQVSMERYAGVRGWEPLPLFQAVYHQYAISYGNYSSLLNPPYDEMWPSMYKPQDALKPLDSMFNKQFMMEQARSFVWGMQPMISNYSSELTSERKEEIDYLFRLAKVRNNNLKYLLYGKYVRAQEMIVPQEELDISKLSIYAGHNEKVTAFKKVYPTVYSSFWLTEDNMLGIALASIHDKNFPIHMKFKAEDYKLSPSGKLYVTGEREREFIGTYSNGIIDLAYMLPAYGISMIEVVPD